MQINTNVAALTTVRNLSSAHTAFGKSVERLSSGLRINRAGDDAAGLSLNEKLRAQLVGTNQSVRDAQDAISMIQTAEGALTEVHAMLQRMRELAVQFLNDTLTSNDRNAIITELNQLDAEIDAIAGRTTFNGQFLLKGALDGGAAAIGVHQGSELRKGSFNADILVTDVTFTLAADGTDAADTYFFSWDAATGLLTATRQSEGATATYDTDSSLLTAAGDADSFTLDFTTGSDVTLEVQALSGFADSDDIGLFLTATGTGSLRTTLTGGNKSAQYQLGPDSGQVMRVDFEEVTASSLSYNIAPLEPALGSSAVAFMVELDADIQEVSEIRSNLGAAANRLAGAINANNIAAENTSAAESRILDVDVSSESVNLGRLRILEQAGVAVLAQANLAPQTVLRLLI
ncbi:MAG: flagellin [Chloroflexi bacterium]|nr:flagellin [Chloroflexota bacterium]